MPKSPDHRKAISRTIKAGHEVAHCRLMYAIEAIDKGDDLAVVVDELVFALSALVEATKQKTALYCADVAALRRELQELQELRHGAEPAGRAALPLPKGYGLPGSSPYLPPFGD